MSYLYHCLVSIAIEEMLLLEIAEKGSMPNLPSAGICVFRNVICLPFYRYSMSTFCSQHLPTSERLHSHSYTDVYVLHLPRGVFWHVYVVSNL